MAAQAEATSGAATPRRLNEGGEKFRGRVMNPKVFRVYMWMKMPALGVTGTWLSELNLDRCEAVLPFGWGTRNLFGKMHTAALAAAGEVASVCLWMINIRNQPVGLVPVPVEVTVHAARPLDGGPVHMRAQGGDAYGAIVEQVAASLSPAELETTVEGVTTGGEVVCEVRIRWRIEPK